ncbi:T6SS immunity protein Tdi1 domain-containing protein [Promicromonospora sukumoe]|uniref:T6SS immunity protein Tdi1 domain-containing protein n=1 Tax=Promicromonospora sukumoe TaxID=88382 RepID=UPI00365EA380
MKLLRTFPKVAFEFGLASWQWMGIREQTPRFATCFGDIFLESLDGWWFLDTVEGTLELRWNSAVTMYAELESADGRSTYLMDDLVRDARSRGLTLGEEDVYTFNPHPALGGELGVDGLGTMRFELALNWVGQMHDRVRHSSGEIRLPPMPDGGRRAAPAPVAEPWDSTWSHDETFDVPFEQYLATTTFAAVSARRNADAYPSLPPTPAREDTFGQAPYAAPAHGSQGLGPQGRSQGRGSQGPGRQEFGSQGFRDAAYDALGPAGRGYDARRDDAPDDRTRRARRAHDGTGQDRAGHDGAGHDGAQAYQTPSALDRPWSDQPWSQENQAAPPWSGQTESAQPWLEPQQPAQQHQAAQPPTPPGGYAAPYDPNYPAAPEPYGASATEQPGAQYDPQPWAPYETGQDAGHAPDAQAAPVWDAPTWGAPPPPPPPGSQQRAPRADDSFTAWDDLWGRR